MIRSYICHSGKRNEMKKDVESKMMMNKCVKGAKSVMANAKWPFPRNISHSFADAYFSSVFLQFGISDPRHRLMASFIPKP